eukprot:scaffold15321_cov116-Isochrysis_galbana.AAC.7
MEAIQALGSRKVLLAAGYWLLGPWLVLGYGYGHMSMAAISIYYLYPSTACLVFVLVARVIEC